VRRRDTSPRAAHLHAALVLGAAALGAAPVAGERAHDPPARIVAQALAEAVSARDPAAAAILFAVPVSLDGEAVTSPEVLVDRWRQVLAREDLAGLVLEEIEVLDLDEATTRYGPPPPRLGAIDRDALVAVIRWNRAQLVVVLARREGRWAIVAVTD
jgi:hypothetical protein